ncbi:hypothetical protein JVU11DRAFT_10949 [Chiua virens]|nr:hypothetical protein JVU11DRAFT_10949 [Chiua virens]
MAYILVSWTWLAIEARHASMRISNGTAEWIQDRLGVHLKDTLFLPDTEPYEFQFVDTSGPAREGDQYLHTIPIDTSYGTRMSHPARDALRFLAVPS